MNLAEKALTTMRANEQTKLLREKVVVAMEAPEGGRDALLVDALATAVEVIDALTKRLLADSGPVGGDSGR